MPSSTRKNNSPLITFTPVPVEELHSDTDDDGHGAPYDELTSRQAYCLYVSHSLSMWNSRMYEFSVILFIQAAFPGNLRASSINGIAETSCVLFFSGALGRWVDHNPSRLQSLLLTININRISIAASCITWLFILTIGSSAQKNVGFAISLFLGMAEKLSRATNILCMERDWVPILASPCVDASFPTPYDLTHLNTVMRRIDMLCKLVAPLAVSAFISTIGTERIAGTMVAAISTLSWPLECWCVRQVWKQIGQLRAPKDGAYGTENGGDANESMPPGLKASKKRSSACLARDLIPKAMLKLSGSVRAYGSGLQDYFSSAVWIPSICAAVPHASVLTFSGTMITYLLNTGLSLNMVTGARASGAFFEIGSTIVFPYAVRTFAAATEHATGEHAMEEYQSLDAETRSHPVDDIAWDDGDHDSHPILNILTQSDGILTVGQWSIFLLWLSLLPPLLCLFKLDSIFSNGDPTTTTTHDSPLRSHLAPTLLLILFISVSLLFRWTYDLCATQLTQTLVPATKRSSFGGTEMSVVSILSLAHWVSAAVWDKQSDFKWLALGSFVMVWIAALAYWGWKIRWQPKGI